MPSGMGRLPPTAIRTKEAAVIDDIIQRIEHLRAVHQKHQELEAELAQVRFLRVQLIRSILGVGVSEFHVAAQLGATPEEVRRWGWRAA